MTKNIASWNNLTLTKYLVLISGVLHLLDSFTFQLMPLTSQPLMEPTVQGKKNISIGFQIGNTTQDQQLEQYLDLPQYFLLLFACITFLQCFEIIVGKKYANLTLMIVKILLQAMLQPLKSALENKMYHRLLIRIEINCRNYSIFCIFHSHNWTKRYLGRVS